MNSLQPVDEEEQYRTMLQERVNKSTKATDADAVTNSLKQSDYDKISKKQSRVKELMRLLADKLGKENGVEGGK